MTGMAKMMMLNSTRRGRETEGRDREWVIREREPEQNYGESYNEMREYRNDMEYDMDGPESRRRRYKNGRFAPSSEHLPNKWKEGPVRKPMNEGGTEMRMIGFERDEYSPSGRAEYNGGGESRMEYGRMNYTSPEAHEMEHRKSEKRAGHASSRETGMSYEKARRWVHKMRNADGTRGAHWKIEEVEELLEKKKMHDCDPVEVWVAMNAEYSDRCKVNEKFGITSPEYYLEMAKAFWLEDEDAVPDKLMAYYECIVK